MNWLLKLVRSLFLVSLAVTISSPISSKTVHIKLFNIDNGLSQSGVTCVIQDSYGFLWVATQDGLNRYDGYNFKTYRNNPLDSNSLANNYINSICEDKKGNIWVGTSRGLSVLNRNTGKFVNYYNKFNDQSTISDNRIYTVYTDRDGIVWVKTLSSIDMFDAEKGTFERFSHYNNLFTFSSDLGDFDICEDSQGVLWVGTKDGLCFFDRQVKIFKRFTNDPKDPSSISSDVVKDIFEDSFGNLWIGTDNGLNLYNRNTKKFTRFFTRDNSSNDLHSSIINTLYQDKSGLIWIGTDVGFSSFNPVNYTLVNYDDLNYNGDKFLTSFVSTFNEDRSGILWIGTFQGLIKWDRKPPKFKLYSKSTTGDPLFANNIVASIAKDAGGIVWVGTWGAGLFRFNPTTGAKLLFSSKEPNRYIPNDFIHTIFITRQNEIVVGTRDGLLVYKQSINQFVNYFTYKGINALGLFSNNRIYSIAEDRNDNLWVATKIGLFQLSGKTLIGYYNNPNDTSTITEGEVFDVMIDKDGFVWAGTTSGLNRIDPNTKVINRFVRKEVYTPDHLVSNEILSLLQDSNGYIWVGTANGLHRYDCATGKFKLYTEEDGLPNNLIYSIEEDNKGRIWIGTNWGLAVLNPETELIKSFDVADGLQSLEFNVNSSHKSKSGELFFGGISGYNSFFPDSINSNVTLPNIAITAFELLGEKGKKSASVDGSLEITIPKEFNAFAIEFSALDFTRPENNRYSYQMRGISEQWIDLGTKHSATFSNLSAGTYYFTVKGANSDLTWNEQGKTLKIVVKTPIWKSNLANVIYMILILGSIIFYVRNRTKHFRKTSHLLKEREFAMSEVEKQKEELVYKNKNITDSINYAKRLQEAILPSVAQFKKLLPDSFLLYMPKDIVSGDFYWVNETKNKLFVAVVDCTGHGVPGAFMSIIGIELLRNITSVQGVNDSAEILNRLNTGVIQTFSKEFLEDNALIKDGMDVAFCIIDKENNILQFSGAFSNLYLIRDSKITEIKGDRYSVGMGNNPERQLFSSHYIPIQPDDMIYIFTDGYTDQFGGPESKKYKFRRFRHLLLNIHKYPLETQRQYLEDSIMEWKGENDQVDDILIIGIKPDLSCLF